MTQKKDSKYWMERLHALPGAQPPAPITDDEIAVALDSTPTTTPRHLDAEALANDLVEFVVSFSPRVFVKFLLSGHGGRLHIARVHSTVPGRGFGERAVLLLTGLATAASFSTISAEIADGLPDQMERRRKFFSKCGFVAEVEAIDCYTLTLS
jgi:hypothetical protein